MYRLPPELSTYGRSKLMTKKDFVLKLDSAYSEAIKKYANNDVIKNMLSDYADDNGKIDSSSIAVMAMIESVKMNKDILKSVLLEVLEFDE